MNALATVAMTDPHGKVSECIRFTIDDASDPFVLDDVMVIGRQYTFSLWIMSDANAAISAVGNTFATSGSWNRYFVTFDANSTSLLLNFNETGDYYIYHPQLEIGNKVTDWTPAPEDQPEQMEARFKVESDKVEAEFTIINDTIDDLGKVVREKYTKTITENENGITITDSNGVYSVQLDNVEGVVIKKDGVIRSQLKDDDFYTGNIVVRVEERAQFGNFAFIPRSDGSLSFLKVGE